MPCELFPRKPSAEDCRRSCHSADQVALTRGHLHKHTELRTSGDSRKVAHWHHMSRKKPGDPVCAGKPEAEAGLGASFCAAEAETSSERFSEVCSGVKFAILRQV